MRLRVRADLPTRAGGIGPPVSARLPAEPQQLLHLVEREPEILGALDEANDPHRLVGELPIAGRTARRPGEQPAAFVVAQRLDVHTRLPGGFANPHRQAPGDKYEPYT